MNLESARAAFPQLARTTGRGLPITYLDSAATSLKPRPVIDAVCDAMSHSTGAIHRSVHVVGDEATEIYEGARRRVAWHLGAEEHEIVFVANATDGINLIARGWPDRRRVVTFLGDHHSSLLPWPGEVTRLVPRADGTLDPDTLQAALDGGDVSLVCLSHVSNVTGAEINVPDIAARVHAAGAVLVLDAAQSAPHRALDVVELDCDFLALSAHKMCGPSGIGALFGKAEHLERLEPTKIGGGMVETVNAESYTPNPVPFRFEAGTPALEAAAGFHAALDFLDELGLDVVETHQRRLTRYALERIRDRLPGMAVVGPTGDARIGAISLATPDHSPHRLARALSDSYGVCVRSGFHCAEPLHQSINLPATLRASVYLYNDTGDIDRFVEGTAELLALSGVT